MQEGRWGEDGMFMNECTDSTMGLIHVCFAVLLPSDDLRTSWSFQLVYWRTLYADVCWRMMMSGDIHEEILAQERKREEQGALWLVPETRIAEVKRCLAWSPGSPTESSTVCKSLLLFKLLCCYCSRLINSEQVRKKCDRNGGHSRGHSCSRKKKRRTGSLVAGSRNPSWAF